MNSDVLDKLKKILARAQAGRGATEAEMKVAMAMAQKLAMEHSIDLASIVLDDGKHKPLETDHQEIRSESSEYRRPHHSPLIGALRRCFQVEFIWLSHDGCHGCFVGEKIDVQLATYCFAWLDPLFPKLHRAYCNQLGISHTKEDTAVRRRCYYEGLAEGIIASNQRQKQAMSAADRNTYALVLVKKEEVVKAKFNELFPDQVPFKQRPRQHDADARGAGHAKGRTIKLTAPLEGGRATAAIK